MNILENIRARAAAASKHIVLPEGEDERTIRAASLCMQERIARLTLIDREEYAARYYEARRAKGVTLDEARQQMDDPLYFGNMMVRERQADGSVSGATHTTGHTVSSALRCIGPKPGLKVVSSFFLMAVSNSKLGEEGA